MVYRKTVHFALLFGAYGHALPLADARSAIFCRQSIAPIYKAGGETGIDEVLQII